MPSQPLRLCLDDMWARTRKTRTIKTWKSSSLKQMAQLRRVRGGGGSSATMGGGGGGSSATTGGRGKQQCNNWGGGGGGSSATIAAVQQLREGRQQCSDWGGGGGSNATRGGGGGQQQGNNWGGGSSATIGLWIEYRKLYSYSTTTQTVTRTSSLVWSVTAQKLCMLCTS